MDTTPEITRGTHPPINGRHGTAAAFAYRVRSSIGFGGNVGFGTALKRCGTRLVQTYNIVGYDWSKPSSLWETTGTNLQRCGTRLAQTYNVVGHEWYNGGHDTLRRRVGERRALSGLSKMVTVEE